MTYVNTRTMLVKANKYKYVVGAFNIVDYISMEDVIKVAMESSLPVILKKVITNLKVENIEAFYFYMFL